ncbi:hypothetical protein GTA09_15280 [Rhodococcus hoagii]|nr:hypothetical protein [Prescottella equi]
MLYTALRMDRRELVKLRREQIIKAQGDIFFNTKVLDDIFADLRARKKHPDDVIEEMDTARRELYRASMIIASTGRYYVVTASSSISTTYGKACGLVAQGKRPRLDLDEVLRDLKLLTAAVRYELGVRNRVTIRERIGIRIQNYLQRNGANVVDMSDVLAPEPDRRSA